jgi:dTDP-4-dehydrorhamnose reductase
MTISSVPNIPYTRLHVLTSTAWEDLAGGLAKSDLWGRLGWLDVNAATGERCWGRDCHRNAGSCSKYVITAAELLMRSQCALVTGATGFIGRHLVAELIDAQKQVVALVRPRSRVPDQWRGRVIGVECADWSEAGLRAALASQSFDVAFHLAAYGVRPTDRDPGLMLRINVDLPALLVHLCQERGARLVMAGTFSEYQGPADRRRLTEQPPLETGKIYGASKAAGGIVASALAESLGVKLRLLRFFRVYRVGEAPHRLLPTLVAGLSRGERVQLSDGTQVRDFIWINGGFFVCEPSVFDYIEGDATSWERTPLERLARDGELMAYQHTGFWKPMDTLRDKRELEEFWANGKAPWKIW